MRRLLIVAALLTTALCLPPQQGSSVTAEKRKDLRCIPGCKCTYTNDYEVKISRCDHNIALNRSAFSNVGIRTVTTMQLVGAVIEKFDKNAFQGLKGLQVLSFKSCQFGNFELNATSLNKLRILSFIDCEFRFDIQTFDSESLQELVFNNCKLLEVPALGDLVSLEYLDLRNNNIAKISNETFTDLDSLTTLNLSNNNITMIPPDAFYYNTQLNTLILDGNPLKMFSLNSDLILEYLSIGSCELTVFDRAITKYLTSLNRLNLTDNKIAVIPRDTLKGLQDLEYIDLSGNRLKHLDAEVFSTNTKLKKITLNKNRFETLPDFSCAKGSTFATKIFQCRECQLKHLSNYTFSKMPSIEILDLSNNNLPNINNYLQYIPSLVTLKLEGNYIGKISARAFDRNRNLKTLKLTGNPLTTISPRLFIYNVLLSSLDVSETDLKQIWSDNDVVLKSIEHMRLSESQIKTIRPSDLKVTPNLRDIDIENNPLKCSQDFYESLVWLIGKEVARVVEIKDDLSDVVRGNIIKNWTDMAKNVCPNNQSLIAKVKSAEDRSIYDDNQDDDDEWEDYTDIPTSTVEKGKKSNDKKSKDAVVYYYYYDDDYIHTQTDKLIDVDGAVQGLKEDIPELVQEIDENSPGLSHTWYLAMVGSVFVLTALLVVTVTMCATLCFLKRSNRLAMHQANLPRFKIPLWSSAHALKKHSGSVYHTLTEENTSQTPQLSRHEYHFSSTPSVHNA